MLSRSSEYAIRALTHLASRPERGWILSRRIAAELGIPSSFLAKILQTLASVGILESQRGRNGGFRLLREPHLISLFEIVEPFDRLGQRRLCILGQKVCDEASACPLHDTWKKSLSLFLVKLQETTLEEVARHNAPGGFPRPTSPSEPAPTPAPATSMKSVTSVISSAGGLPVLR